MPEVQIWRASLPHLVQHLGKYMREQMIAHLTVEVAKAVGVGEGALPEAVKVEAVELEVVEVEAVEVEAVEVDAVVGAGVVE